MYTKINIFTDQMQYPDAQSSNANFIYNITDYRFDQVSAYYHCDEFENWLYSKGLESNRVDKVTVSTENPYVDPAGTIAASRIIKFAGDNISSEFNNPLWDAAVIAHEYMHIVSYTYNTHFNDFAMSKAMFEAYSDYFGLVYCNKYLATSSSVICEYLDVPNDNVDYTRDLDNSWTTDDYDDIDLEPNYITQEHDRSVIFSGGLWNLRNDPDVSSSIVDQIVLKSLNYLTDQPSFLLGKDALIAAANYLGYSSYEDDIRDNFHTHGIPFAVTSNISGPTSLVFRAQGTFDANPGGVTDHICTNGDIDW